MAFIGSNVITTPTPSGQPASASIVIDGSIPKISANDGEFLRAQIGNLPAQGNSPAQWGFRALDAAGNPIFDSFGLMQVMSGIASLNAMSGTSTSTTWAQIGSSTSITLSRTQNIFAIAAFTATVSGTSYPAGLARLRINLNGQLSQQVTFAGTTPGTIYDYRTQGTFLVATNLAQSSYTLKVEAQVDANATNPNLILVDGTVQVFLMGG